MQETWVSSLGQEYPLEKGMATHSSILACKISWAEELGGLQSIGSQRVGHYWATSTHTKTIEFKLWSEFSLLSLLSFRPIFPAISWTFSSEYAVDSLNSADLVWNNFSQNFYIVFFSSLCIKSLHSGPTRCNPMDCSTPGSSVHEILQARILEWVAIPFSRGSSWPRDWTSVSYISCIGWEVLYH